MGVFRNAFIILFVGFSFAVSPEAQSGSKEENACNQLLTQIYEGQFAVKLRGEVHKIRFIKNRRQLSKTKDIVVVLPGLNKPAFEEQVAELGNQGMQAVSMDFTNINDVGPFLSPTPEEDALIVNALMTHLKLKKRNFKKKIFLISHSRGALVSGRFFSEFGKNYNIAGLVQMNPYVGWIPDYHEISNGKQLSSGVWLMHSYLALVPGVNMALQSVAQGMEAAAKYVTRSALHFYGDIHDQNQAHKNLTDVIQSDDPILLENIRQKLIGMERAEVVNDLQLLNEKNVPVLIVRGTRDELVPAGMIDTVAGYFDIPVEVLEGGHYLPYSQTKKTTRLILKFIREKIK